MYIIHNFFKKVKFYYSVERLSYFGLGWADVHYALLFMHKAGKVVDGIFQISIEKNSKKVLFVAYFGLSY